MFHRFRIVFGLSARGAIWHRFDAFFRIFFFYCFFRARYFLLLAILYTAYSQLCFKSPFFSMFALAMLFFFVFIFCGVCLSARTEKTTLSVQFCHLACERKHTLWVTTRKKANFFSVSVCCDSIGMHFNHSFMAQTTKHM